MRCLVIDESPIEVKVTDETGNVTLKRAIIQQVRKGVSPHFMDDLRLWLQSRDTAQWAGLPVFVYYRGGDKFPLHQEIPLPGYSGGIHAINIEANGEEGKTS